jgi:hypothetical protein
MRWKAPSLQRAVPHRKYLLRARSTGNLVMELNRRLALPKRYRRSKMEHSRILLLLRLSGCSVVTVRDYGFLRVAR